MIEMVVQNKAQLMAAIDAVSYDDETVVTLIHSRGKTTYKFPQKKYLEKNEFEQHLRRVVRAIKSTPAEYFQ